MRRLPALACGLVLLVPAPAWGDTVAPPGNSAVDQYFEVVPSLSGGRPEGPSRHTPLLPARTRRALDLRGREGRAVAQLADATAPPPSALPSPPGSPGSPSRRPAGSRIGHLTPPSVPMAPPGAPPTAVRAVAAGGDVGGMGAWMPIVLVLTLAGGVAAAIARRGRG